jgi:epoxide hydrolase-like predicted phosphatase
MSELRGLVVDWGGVLTGDLGTVVRAWAHEDGIDLDVYYGVMRDWFGEPIGAEARLNPIHALERGEMSLPDFEVRLAEALTARTGRQHDAAGLLERMFAKFEHAPDMAALVRRARGSGLRTGLLSNSWGNDYPRDGWEEMFDVVVISGEVGMRKPEPRIFEHTLSLIGLEPGEVVFVDDLRHNIEAAVAAGFVGVHHTSYAATLAELEVLFGRDLS